MIEATHAPSPEMRNYPPHDVRRNARCRFEVKFSMSGTPSDMAKIQGALAKLGVRDVEVRIMEGSTAGIRVAHMNPSESCRPSEKQESGATFRGMSVRELAEAQGIQDLGLRVEGDFVAADRDYNPGKLKPYQQSFVDALNSEETVGVVFEKGRGKTGTSKLLDEVV